jgi:hypothetical protein
MRLKGSAGSSLDAEASKRHVGMWPETPSIPSGVVKVTERELAGNTCSEIRIRRSPVIRHHKMPRVALGVDR